ncbi:class I SAM-dependent methyltransferase [Gramella sp. MT6]|uniref:class I SAM-dependent methyltransferase n=1 Tax=Gramella sp. MT6 TaxID=2705471 RepID=UPI001C5E5CD9|nr:class I SAM-dependent methyltransferase [Gramella sp. MT6]QYA24033.1 class I SAM-dependent methyltransferase [Gramella sp. MT6]
MMAEQEINRNKQHYEKIYSNYGIKNILYWINNLDEFLDSAISTETSWSGLYKENFRDRIAGKRIMELGCGNCVNAAIMAALGANVYANDIADASGEIIEKLNESYNFKYPIKFIRGDFLKNEIESEYFDFVVGKAFLHHLDLDLEQKFISETVRILKQDGEARFFEPAVNNLILDKVRWYIPVKGRPSKFNRSEFLKWKLNDPHPERTFRSSHFERLGEEFFKEVKVIPVGTLERFSRIMKWGESRNSYKRWALKNEGSLPQFLNRSFARSQVLIYKNPIK